jgi:four helix bundle protein
MKTSNFRDLEIWQKAMALTLQIYKATKTFPKEEMFGLTSQLRRAAVSIPSNIAEGRGRLSDKAFLIFIGHARGSLYEVQTQMELAHGLGYVDDAEANKITANCIELSQKLNAFLNKLKEDNG